MDIFQGDSEFIVDNEYLGSIKIPAAAAGKKIDFRLDEECLLKVAVEESPGTLKDISLATRDTPEALKQAIAEELARRNEAGPGTDEPGRGGLFSRFKRILGGGG